LIFEQHIFILFYYHFKARICGIENRHEPGTFHRT